MPVSCVPVCAGGAAGSFAQALAWVVSLGDPAGDAVGLPCPRKAGNKPPPRPFESPATEVRCMLGGLGFDALGPAPSTMPDAGPGRLVGGPGRARASPTELTWRAGAGQGPGLARRRRPQQKRADPSGRSWGYDTNPDEVINHPNADREGYIPARLLVEAVSATEVARLVLR